MNDDEYKDYIYDNIKKIVNHFYIINIIKETNCNYTENKNGFFINLNDIETDSLKKIYNIIQTQDKKNNINEINDIIIKNIKDELNGFNKEKKKIPPVKKDIYIHELSELNKEIINFIK